MKSATAKSAELLWIDDNPRQIRPISTFFKRDGVQINLNIVETLEEANDELEKKKFHGVVVDLNMQPTDMYRDNGADWLLEFNEEYKYIPSFIYSGWLNDPTYSKILEKSYVIDSMSKNDTFSEPYSKHWFLSSVIENTLNLFKVSDFSPESISFSDYIKNSDKYADEVGVHWARFGHWLSKYISRNNLAWIVMCGNSVIKKSKNLRDFPNEEELMEIGRCNDRIPFAYSEAYLPEETKWTKLPQDDYYPNIMVNISGNNLQDDFDTGAVQTHVSDKIVKKGLLDAIRDTRGGSHLGERYSFFTKKVDIIVETEQGNNVRALIPLAVVQNWNGTSFAKIRLGRKALLGRDILNDLELVVMLDGRNKNSIIK